MSRQSPNNCASAPCGSRFASSLLPQPARRLGGARDRQTAVPRRNWASARTTGRAAAADRDREFVAKLGVAVEEADESVLWLTLIVQSGISEDARSEGSAGEGRELLAILSKSHKTARENRQRIRRVESQICDLAIRQFTNSPIRQVYRSPSMISSSASRPGRVRSSGRVASGSSTTLSCVRKSSRSGSM